MNFSFKLYYSSTIKTIELQSSSRAFILLQRKTLKFISHSPHIISEIRSANPRAHHPKLLPPPQHHSSNNRTSTLQHSLCRRFFRPRSSPLANRKHVKARKGLWSPHTCALTLSTKIGRERARNMWTHSPGTCAAVASPSTPCARL